MAEYVIIVVLLFALAVAVAAALEYRRLAYRAVAAGNEAVAVAKTLEEQRDHWRELYWSTKP